MSEITIPSLKKIEHYLPLLEESLKNRGIFPEMPIISLSDLNSILWGMPRGKVTVIGARTSHGKTTFAIQLAYDLALVDKRVLFLSLEMTVVEMLERLFCYEYRIDNRELIRGQYKNFEHKFKEFQEDVKRLKLVFSDCIGKSWQEVEEILEKLNPKPDAIFIDHINAIQITSNNAKRDIDEYLSKIVDLTKHHNISTILCCQINRDNQRDDDKTPQLHELKGTGNIEEIADRALLLHWPHKYHKAGDDISKNKYMVIVAKNRQGETGYINLHFEPKYYRFSNYRKTQKEEISQEKQLEIDVINQKTES